MNGNHGVQKIIDTVSITHSPYRILVVDDSRTMRKMLRLILELAGMEVEETDCGKNAIRLIAENDFDAVLLDLQMPDMDGFSVCRHIRENMGKPFLPVVIVTSSTDVIDEVFQAGASDYIVKPVHKKELIARVQRAVERKRLTDQVHQSENVLFGLARAIDMRDMHDVDHCERLADMCREFGDSLCCTELEIESLCQAAWLHDIGKIAVPDRILLKQDTLTPEEWSVVHKHPLVGHEICLNFRSIPHTLQIIRYHHERWDGKGYPEGLSGHDIPKEALIFQLLDAFDALTSDRPYQDAYTTEEALDIMQQEGAEGRWSPFYLDAFIEFITNSSY